MNEVLLDITQGYGVILFIGVPNQDSQVSK